MQLFQIDPVRDARWTELVDRHPDSSIYHLPEWLEALRHTYGYQPVAFADAEPGSPIGNALVFCAVNSWVTGRRYVSLPFSDHCEPLVDGPEVLSSMLSALVEALRGSGRYVELRCRHSVPGSAPFQPSDRFCEHRIDLRQPLDEIFSRFHRNHVQRAIRKAERLGSRMQIEAGRSADLLASFYGLQQLTRQRLGVPVQPMRWFEDVVECLGTRATILLARVDGRPVASILVASHARTMVYKYGCSDAKYKHFAATPLLFWTAIQEAKRQGLETLDLGRSDLGSSGLIAFKDHLGAERTELRYYRHYPRAHARAAAWTPSVARLAYSFVPKAVQVRVGSRLYKHFA